MSQAEFKRRLKALMLRPENQVCSDCPERQPRWASLIVPPPGAPPGSLPMGAFCCLECSGSHRRLGVHISFVRSVNLDQWKEKEVLAMENGGNQKVNAIFEAHLNVAKPNNAASGPVRERFIRDKYERRKFYDPRAFESAAQMSNGGHDEEQVIAGVQRRLASQRGTPSSSRKPSDAARRRVEERAARNRSGGGGGSNVAPSKPVKSPVRAEAPAPVADLLDFGDFNSVEAASSFGQTAADSTPAALATPNNAAPPAPAAIDMFADMSSPAPAGQTQPQQQQQQPEKKTMSNADIMSMFSTPNPQHNNPMQQNMFAMQNGMGGGMGGGNNNMMMNANNNMGMMNQQQQMGMNNMGMGMGGNMNQMMGMQQNGMNQMNNMNMMGGNMNQMMMMQQQQQQNQMQQMNMMGGNNNMMMQGGGMMQGNQFGSPMQTQQKQQQQQRGSGNVNQFADFGNFGR